MLVFFLFVKDLLPGLAIAAPLGPVGALCISRAVERGLWDGVLGGLGTALADALYAGFAAFTAVLVSVDGYLRAGGGVFMPTLGMHILLKRPTEKRRM